MALKLTTRAAHCRELSLLPKVIHANRAAKKGLKLNKVFARTSGINYRPAIRRVKVQTLQEALRIAYKSWEFSTTKLMPLYLSNIMAVKRHAIPLARSMSKM